MKSSKIIAVVIALAVLAWIVSGLPGGQGTPEETTQDNKKAEAALVQVQVRESTAQDYRDMLRVTGRSQASRSVEIRAETEGQLIELFHEEGDKVTGGDALARLETRDRNARVRETQERVTQKRIEYEAAKKLEARGFNSKVRLAQTLAELESAKAEAKAAEIEMGNTTIKAPFKGIIDTQSVELGDYLKVSDPVFTLKDLDPVEIIGFVSERQIQDLQTGTTAKIEFLNGMETQGTLSYIAPAANEQTRTFRVLIRVENPDLTIKEGLTAEILMPGAARQAHKISPAILSLNDEGQIGVKIVDAQEQVRFIPVTILSDNPDSMWVSGIPDVTRIITVGQEFVTEGQTVEAVRATGEGLL